MLKGIEPHVPKCNKCYIFAQGVLKLAKNISQQNMGAGWCRVWKGHTAEHKDNNALAWKLEEKESPNKGVREIRDEEGERER